MEVKSTMNLYEINSQILDCIDQETGEVMDIDRLEELNMAKAVFSSSSRSMSITSPVS